MIPRDNALSPPAPEVVFLPTLFRRIQSGEVRIPAFQRGFVWEEDRILALLESVYRGYPIGSLLLWRVDRGVLRVESPQMTVFPQIEERYPCNFVLDGLQRLSSLYAVLHFDPTKHDQKFNVLFDLDTREFIEPDEKTGEHRCISMNRLFVPKDFLETQRLLSEQPDAEDLLNEAISLHSSFQEYQIPVVTITGRSVRDVVQVFERINSSGMKLDAVDFMRAATWSEDFDLTAQIEAICHDLAESGFNIPSETVAKVLAVVMGKDPTPSSMLELRDSSAGALLEGMNRVKAAVSSAVALLSEEVGILSYDYVPYEGQLLVLARLCDLQPDPSPLLIDKILHWFWAVGFNEELRGKPDHYVSRILGKVEALVNGVVDEIAPRPQFGPMDFMERRMIKGKALSGACAAMFAKRGARSILTGESISPEDYMLDFSPSTFAPVLTLERLNSICQKPPVSMRLLANLIVLSSADKALLRGQSVKKALCALLEKFGEQDRASILRSQCMTETSLRMLHQGDDFGFLTHRGIDMFNSAQGLILPDADVW